MNQNSSLQSTRDFVHLLKSENEILEINQEVDPNLELAELHREVVKRKGPALLFTKVKGTPFSVATNLYGSRKRMELAFGPRPTLFVKDLANLIEGFLPPNFNKIWEAKHVILQGLKIGVKKNKKAKVWKNEISPLNILKLPQLKSWPEDGGSFITLPLVYTESPVTGKSNLGMYRIQFHDAKTAGVHIQIHRGSGYHYHEAEQVNQSLRANIFIGGPPALTIAAIAPLPENITELLFASLLLGKRIDVAQPEKALLRVVSEADFCIQGEIPPFERKPEGPFGDHYGYYSLQHAYPFMNVKSIHYRDGAIFPATVVGRPPQEDHFIAEYLQEILSPLFPIVMPNVKQIWAYEESGVHSLAAAIVKNRYPKEAFTAALRILGEGQLSLTKFLLVTNKEVDLKNVRQVLVSILERADLKTDLFVFSNISQDTLDYTGPKVNEGSKAILIGLGEKKYTLKKEFNANLNNSKFDNPLVFCPGVLCIEGSEFSKSPKLAQTLMNESGIQEFKLVFLVEDAGATCKSSIDFIWHTFTRFEPAADFYGKKVMDRMHIAIEGPLIIDCRMKPWYPGVLISDSQIRKNVEKKFGDLLNKLE